MGIHAGLNTLRTFKLGLFEKGEGNGLLANLLLAYTHNEATNATRVDCASGIDALKTGAGDVVSNPDGALDSASEFPSTGYLVSPNNTDLNILKNVDFTVCTWIKLDAGGSGIWLGLGSAGFGTGTNNLLDLHYEGGSDRVGVSISQDTGSASFDFFDVNGSTPVNAWMFVCIKYTESSRGLLVKLNGVIVINKTLAGNQQVNNDIRTSFGSRANGGAFFVNGGVDNSVVYDRLLKDTEEDYYHSGGGLNPAAIAVYYFNTLTLGADEGPNNIALTPHGAFGSNIGILGSAIEFNGTNGGADSATHVALDNLRENSFSITLWGYMDAAHSGDANFLSLLSGFSTGELLLTISYADSADGVSANLYSDGGATSDNVFQNIGGSMPRDTWFSIQVTFDEPTLTLRMRLNNQAFGSVVLANTTNVDPGLRVTVGDLLAITFFLDGRVDEATIFDEVITDEYANRLFMNGMATKPTVPGRIPCA